LIRNIKSTAIEFAKRKDDEFFRSLEDVGEVSVCDDLPFCGLAAR